jgi:KUP system potassium uptake protein
MTTTAPTQEKLGPLMLAALGVVYGDIGTSPLYAFKEAFAEGHGLTPTPENVIAALSAFLWSIALIISVKYVWIVLRFDNKGEGGVLALQALAQRHARRTMPQWIRPITLIGVFAAALFYGDAILTPAISVLSAVEGISVATPQFEHWILPITLGILLSLFLMQKQGTAKVGQIFGPITVVWFGTLACLGLISIIQTPEVLKALSPWFALKFTLQHPIAAFLLLSAVFLSMTGGEALYADMGHFGAKPIRYAWYGLVWPALTLNYLGQGALVMRDSSAALNPFYLLSPEMLMIPLVILATMATVIASQATISGAYSLTFQAIRLGYLPRIRIEHTSDTSAGQIYIASVNWLLLIGVVLLVIAFQSSSNLAAAYGVAVSGTMVITTILVLIVAQARPNQRLRQPIIVIMSICGGFEIMFLASNLMKIGHGGWLPLLIGVIIFTILTTWKKGSELVYEQRRKMNRPVRKFITQDYPTIPHVNGTAIYLNSNPNLVPSGLFYNLKHYKALHSTLIFLHVVNEEVPYVPDSERLTVVGLSPEVYTIGARFGFREQPDLTRALQSIDNYQLAIDFPHTTFFITRSVVVSCGDAMAKWRCSLYAWMVKQSESSGTYFNLPADQVVEIGTQIKL